MEVEELIVSVRKSHSLRPFRVTLALGEAGLSPSRSEKRGGQVSSAGATSRTLQASA